MSVAERGMYSLHRNSRILNTRWIDELRQPVFIGPSGTATTFEWFSANTTSGVHTVCKSGGQPGVATTMYMIPSENLACLALTNRSDGIEFAFSISNLRFLRFFECGDLMIFSTIAGLGSGRFFSHSFVYIGR